MVWRLAVPVAFLLGWFVRAVVAGPELPIAPVLCEDAWLVARIQLDKVAPLYAAWHKALGLQALPSQERADRFIARLRGAGARELVYFRSAASSGYAFVPLPPGADAAVVEQALRQQPFPRLVEVEATGRLGDGVFAGGRGMLAYLRRRDAAVRASVRQALAATSGSTLQVLLCPDNDNRQELQQFARELSGSPAARAVMREIGWASIGIDGPEAARLRIVLEAKDTDAAARLQANVKQFSESLLMRPAVRKNVALVENLRRVVTPRRDGKRLMLDLRNTPGELTTVTRGLIQPVFEDALAARARPEAIKKLKQLALALHNYHDAFKRFPPAILPDEQGKPLLSWRVLILPFIDRGELYGEFNLDEAWDSPHNLKLLDRMPDIFRCPMARVPEDHTVFLVPSGEDTVFSTPRGTAIRQIIDGTSKTIAIVEADDAHAVPWTKPDDWPYDPDNPTFGLGKHFGDRFLTAFCDGSMHALPGTIDPETMRRMITYAGREVLQIPQ